MSFLLKREMLSGHEMNSIEIDAKNECCDELEIHEDLLKIVQETVSPHSLSRRIYSPLLG